jgi:hypothetical protein
VQGFDEFLEMVQFKAYPGTFFTKTVRQVVSFLFTFTFHQSSAKLFSKFIQFLRIIQERIDLSIIYVYYLEERKIKKHMETK